MYIFVSPYVVDQVRARTRWN